MEELNNKLFTGSPIVISQIFSKLTKNILDKIKNQQNENLDTAEFKFLEEKCFSDDNAVSVIASNAIIEIVRNSNILTKSVITDFITVITTTKCSPNLAFLIRNLLLIDLENELHKNGEYKCVFNLRLPQHPFIIMLNEDVNSWNRIFKEITYSYKGKETNVISCCNNLYKPVFLYTLCNSESNLNMLKQKLWTFIIHEIPDNNHIITCLLSWMQFDYKDTLQINSDFLIELSNFNITKQILNQDLLFLWQISTLQQLLLNHFDPQAMIFSIFNVLDNENNITMVNPGLLMLMKSLYSCPSVYLLQLLQLCKIIINKAPLDPITKQIIKSSLLQWIANPSILISDAIAVAKEIFLLLKNKPIFNKNKEHERFFNKFRTFINTNSGVYISLQQCILIEKLKTKEDVIDLVKKLEETPTFFLVKIVNFLFGLFLSEFDDNFINLRIFELILRCVDYNRTLSSNTLTIILYKLTNTLDSELHYELLKVVPKMAVVKDNLQKIVSTIQALNKGRNTLKTFSTTLMFELWKTENKCYPYLENLLIAPYHPQCDRWEFYITRAHILKELCASKPELYGKEMVAHLSKILNECNNADGALACALAIDGITILCKFEIIDAVTTWATLEPMFKKETRIPVIKSLCSLISEIPNLSYTEAYPKLTEEVIGKLWEYIVLSPDKDVVKAALDALTSFSVDQIVAQMPDDYLDDEMLNLRRTGHVVPGHCWIQFMKNCSSSMLELVGDFLIKMVAFEVSNYLKFVYQVKGTREPVDYSYLATNSVVRGISVFIKSKMLKWKSSVYQEVYLQCLRIFSQEYSRPLPPLDWCFLQELIHEPEAKNFCISIAAHQVVLSGTARRFMVNYIEAIIQNHTNVNDVLNIYSNLKHLANSVQPFTLKPFLHITIYGAIESFKDGNENSLLAILTHLKETLRDKTIQESNKIVIAEIINDIVNESDISSRLFELLLECVILFPLKCIDDVSSPKSCKEINSDWFKKAIKIRTHLALNSKETPLNWLNELIEIGSSFPEITPFMFEQFANVYKKHKDNTECVLWMLELIGQIQALMAEKSDKKEIMFYCNIFILATVVFSGHFVWIKDFSNCDEINNLFPRAIATLLDVNHWSICTTQALEWFYHMNSETDFCKEYRDMFVQCLQSLRHEAEFHKNMKWAKYLNVEC